MEKIKISGSVPIFPPKAITKDKNKSGTDQNGASLSFLGLSNTQRGNDRKNLKLAPFGTDHVLCVAERPTRKRRKNQSASFGEPFETEFLYRLVIMQGNIGGKKGGIKPEKFMGNFCKHLFYGQSLQQE